VSAIGEAADDGGAERTGGVHRSTSVHDGEQMACKERKTDTDGGERRCLVLLGTQHEHGQAKGSSDEHLNEDRLRRVDTRARTSTV
jgi:hypothetical protein